VSFLDSTVNQLSRSLRPQALCCVIRLLGPIVVNEFDSAPVNYDEVAIILTDDNQGRPA
jgi:hypothetical protein